MHCMRSTPSCIDLWNHLVCKIAIQGNLSGIPSWFCRLHLGFLSTFPVLVSTPARSPTHFMSPQGFVKVDGPLLSTIDHESQSCFIDQLLRATAMALSGSLRRLASGLGPSHETGAVAACFSRAVHTLNGFSTAKFASATPTEDDQPVLSGVVPITGPLSAAWWDLALLWESSR